MARMINTVTVDNNVNLNVDTIENYVESYFEDENNPVTFITTVTDRLYNYLGTAEMLNETLKGLINTIVVDRDRDVHLNIATIESYEDVTFNEENPVTLITTISGKNYNYFGTVEMLNETLKIS